MRLSDDELQKRIKEAERLLHGETGTYGAMSSAVSNLVIIELLQRLLTEMKDINQHLKYT
jgi:hypothetical protein